VLGKVPRSLSVQTTVRREAELEGWPSQAHPASAVCHAGVSTNHDQTSSCRWLFGQRRWALVAVYPPLTDRQSVRVWQRHRTRNSGVSRAMALPNPSWLTVALCVTLPCFVACEVLFCRTYNTYIHSHWSANVSHQLYIPQRNQTSRQNSSETSQISSKINIFTTTASFRHFVIFSSKNEVLFVVIYKRFYQSYLKFRVAKFNGFLF